MAEASRKMQVSDEVAIQITGMNKWYGSFHVLRDIDLPADPALLDARVAEALAEHPDNGDLRSAVVLEAAPRKVVVMLQNGDSLTVTGEGLRPVRDASALFLAGRRQGEAGCRVVQVGDRQNDERPDVSRRGTFRFLGLLERDLFDGRGKVDRDVRRRGHVSVLVRVCDVDRRFCVRYGATCVHRVFLRALCGPSCDVNRPSSSSHRNTRSPRTSLPREHSSISRPARQLDTKSHMLRAHWSVLRST